MLQNNWLRQAAVAIGKKAVAKIFGGLLLRFSKMSADIIPSGFILIVEALEDGASVSAVIYAGVNQETIKSISYKYFINQDEVDSGSLPKGKNYLYKNKKYSYIFSSSDTTYPYVRNSLSISKCSYAKIGRMPCIGASNLNLRIGGSFLKTLDISEFECYPTDFYLPSLQKLVISKAQYDKIASIIPEGVEVEIVN